MSKKILLPTCYALAMSFGAAQLLAEGAAHAQQLELPRPSPLAKVSQVVGLTEVAIEYSSPAVKGRKVVGGILPLNQLWRTGANGATKVTFGKDVTVEGSPVPAGTYALFTIPGQASWTVILNKNPNQGGTGQYKQELDQLRFQVKPVPSAHRERLTFLFNDTTETATSLSIEWDKFRLPISIKAATDAQVTAGIKNMEDNSWRPYNNAARYLLESKKDPDHAMALVERSLSLHEDWLNTWTKAQLLAARGKPAEACPLAQKAKALGDKTPDGFFFAEDVKKALADWKCGAH
jgi:hypothetical protein